MLSTIQRFVAIAAIAASTGCVHVDRTSVLPFEVDEADMYRYESVETQAGRLLTDNLLGISLSGGGMRAAALAHGVLLALDEATLASPSGERRHLIEEVDMVSAVSGGSVTAAYWALNGPDRLQTFKERFLEVNIHRYLFGKFITPGTLLRLPTPYYARGDVLRDYFNDKLFEQATYRDLLDASRGTTSRGNARPYLILNSTDMDRGGTFAFTQEWFQLLCADLGSLKLADAVAASTAYPGFFTAVPLKNHINSPDCPTSISQAPRRRVGVLTQWIVDGKRRAEDALNEAGLTLNTARQAVTVSQGKTRAAEKSERLRARETASARKQQSDRFEDKVQAESHEKQAHAAFNRAKRIEDERTTAHDEATRESDAAANELNAARDALAAARESLQAAEKRKEETRQDAEDASKALETATEGRDKAERRRKQAE